MCLGGQELVIKVFVVSYYLSLVVFSFFFPNWYNLGMAQRVELCSH